MTYDTIIHCDNIKLLLVILWIPMTVCKNFCARILDNICGLRISACICSFLSNYSVRFNAFPPKVCLFVSMHYITFFFITFTELFKSYIKSSHNINFSAENETKDSQTLSVFFKRLPRSEFPRLGANPGFPRHVVAVFPRRTWPCRHMLPSFPSGIPQPRRRLWWPQLSLP